MDALQQGANALFILLGGIMVHAMHAALEHADVPGSAIRAIALDTTGSTLVGSCPGCW